jgi:hypothetical protein
MIEITSDTDSKDFDKSLWIMRGDDDIVCSKETWDKIQAFTTAFPGASYGPAHIVLDDNNLMDGHIQFCLDECRKWLENGEGDEWEIQSTIKFLEELLKVPEDIR